MHQGLQLVVEAVLELHLAGASHLEELVRLLRLQVAEQLRRLRGVLYLPLEEQVRVGLQVGLLKLFLRHACLRTY